MDDDSRLRYESHGPRGEIRNGVRVQEGDGNELGHRYIATPDLQNHLRRGHRRDSVGWGQASEI